MAKSTINQSNGGPTIRLTSEIYKTSNPYLDTAALSTSPFLSSLIRPVIVKQSRRGRRLAHFPAEGF